MEISPYYKIKCVFAGEAGVGKTSMTSLIHNDKCVTDPESTIGLAFIATQLSLKEYPLSNPTNLPKYYYEMKEDWVTTQKETQDNQIVGLHVWDTAGNARFFSIIQTYLRDVDVCFLVFDITDKSSWDHLPKWKEEVEKYNNSTLFVIVATKSDLRNHQVLPNEIKERAQRWGAKYYIISSFQANSASLIRSMIYKSVKNYHDNLLHLYNDNKKLPNHVTFSHYNKKVIKYLDLAAKPNQSLCCVIN